MKTNIPFSILEFHKGLIDKKFSALEITEKYLETIEEKNKSIHAYLSVFAEDAKNQAKLVDESVRKNKDIDIMAGVPLAIKDNILIEGSKTTAASEMLKNYTSAYDATVISKLKEKSAVFLGKTNMDEFAMGSSTENSAFGPSKNPLDADKVPGGSSGGSAAAVAMDGALVALGSDTGGSIRQPASFCGLVGMKPTYSTVSRYGLIAMASSFDQIGPIAKTVEDAKILFSAICGQDKNDSTTSPYTYDWREKTNLNLKKLKAGLPREYLVEGVDKEVKQAILDIANKLEKEGVEIKEISLPHSQYALEAYYLIICAEISANLARLDGIRYGHSSKKESKNLDELYEYNRAEGFGKETKRRIMLGTYVLSSGYFDAYYVKASKVRTLIKKDFENAFNDVDFILAPTTPTTAFDFGSKTDDPIVMYLSDIYTISAPLVGIPALSLPVKREDKMPIGLQIMTSYFNERLLLDISEFIEKNFLS